MKENKITVVINKPIDEVFEFTTNPKNTHKWIPSIKEEIAEKFPPKIGTEYRNTGDNLSWDIYNVLEFEKDKTFTLIDSEKNYHVKYTYKSVDRDTTEMEYFEWMENGELNNPFTEAVIINLKSVMENFNDHITTLLSSDHS